MNRHAIIIVVTLCCLQSCSDERKKTLITGASGTSFAVEDSRLSPVSIRIEAREAFEAELSYRVAGGSEQTMDALSGAPIVGNRVQFPRGSTMLSWDFAADLGNGFFPFVEILFRDPAGPVLGGGRLQAALGNEPPVIHRVEPMPSDPSDPSESKGIVEVRLEVSDSTGDLIDLQVEWSNASDPIVAWRVASPAGVPPRGIASDPAGIQLSFFWDTDADLGDDQADVLLRVTADDKVSVGVPYETAVPFRIDNNAEPVVQYFNELVVLNDDERRGIPLPFRVQDEEGDLVELVFQWRRLNEPFPDLPEDPVELDRVLADPALRAELRVCQQFPRVARGRISLAGRASVRLPELAGSESWISAGGLEGKVLELMRPSLVPTAVSGAWEANPLTAPVAAVPLVGGLSVLVLDTPAGSPRLREVELASGRVIREVATLPAGVSTALALERDGAAALVASDLGGIWRIERVELEGGAVTEVAVSDGTYPAPIHGLASLGSSRAVFSVGASLLSVDYGDTQTGSLREVLSGLQEPRGVATGSSGRVFFAESAAIHAGGTGRVMTLDLSTGGVGPTTPEAVASPSALCLSEDENHLYVVTTPASGARLVTIDVRGLAESAPVPLGPVLGVNRVAAASSGPDDLLVLTVAGSDELLVGGGVEQRRTVVGHRAEGNEVLVDDDFEPPPRAGQPWRLSTGDRFRVRSPREGAQNGTFLWDSGEAAGESVFLRALARDDEAGPLAAGFASKRIAPAFGSLSTTVPSPLMGFSNTIRSIELVDVDVDGDLDVVAAEIDGLSIYWQVGVGVFQPSVIARSPEDATVAYLDVEAADFDGDGDLDLAVATAGDQQSLSVYFQTVLRRFDAVPLQIEGELVSPFFIQAADFDGDGDVDLASTARDGFILLHFQTAPGVFDPEPTVLGGPDVLGSIGDLEAADVDGDGDLDLVALEFNSAPLKVFRQTHRGNFDGVPVELGSDVFGDTLGQTPFFGDLDADGDLDLVTLGGSTKSLSLYLQDGDGLLTVEPLVLDVNASIRSVSVFDVDDDEDLDFVFTTSDAFELVTMLQVSPRAFTEALLLRLPDSRQEGFEGFNVAGGDLNGDGKADLVIGGRTTSDFSRALGIVLQSTLGAFPPTPTKVLDESLTVRDTVDLDGDGDLDLVATTARGIEAYYQVAPRVFDPIPRLVSDVNALFVRTADFDSDGDVDVAAIPLFGDDSVLVFRQDGSGQFDSDPLRVGKGFLHLARYFNLADVNADGLLDVLSVASLNTVAVFHQVSPGRYGDVPLALGGPGVTNDIGSILVSDLNGDGIMDVATTNASSRTVTIFFQDEEGAFSSVPIEFDAVATRDLMAEDLNRDGALDLVLGREVFFQTSPGRFDPEPWVLDAPGLTPTPIDLDLDGDLDLVSLPAILIQTNPGSYDRIEGPPSGGRVADLDGDGEYDVVRSGPGPLEVYWGGQ